MADDKPSLIDLSSVSITIGGMRLEGFASGEPVELAHPGEQPSSTLPDGTVTLAHQGGRVTHASITRKAFEHIQPASVTLTGERSEVLVIDDPGRRPTLDGRKWDRTPDGDDQ